jgi:hypothetical protein
MEPGSCPDLTAAILARTSGPACQRLRALACDLVDGALAPEDQTLARGHLEHCPRCRNLVANLALATDLLPGFMEIEPGPAFTEAVLAATQPPPAQEDPLAANWRRLLRRPRFCLEVAYLATAAGFIAIQIPVRPPGAPLIERVAGDAHGWFEQARAGQRIAGRGFDSSRHLERSLNQRGTGLLAALAEAVQGLWRSLGQGLHRAWVIAFPEKHPATEPQAPPRRSSH